MGTTPPSPSRPGKAATPKPKGRKVVRRLRRFLILLLILVGGYYLVTQSFLTRWVVTAIASSLTGGDASASSVRIKPGGTLIVTDANLRAPGVPGEAGTVFSVKRLEATFGWKSLFSGPKDIREITLDQPLARISQSADDGTVNIAALNPKKGGGKGLKGVPRVIVRGGIIELGEHLTDPAKLAQTTDTYKVLKKIDVGGQVVQSPDQNGASIISFHEIAGENPVAGGLSVTGRVSKQSISLTMEGLTLNAWSADAIPSKSSELFRQAEMQGEVPRATITYDYSGGWEANIQLRNVAINLPIKERPELNPDGTPIAGSYDPNRPLRMHNVDGHVVFTNKGVTGNLTGTLEELPYQVEFRVNGTSTKSGFTCTLVSKGFELTSTPQIMRFAPRVVRKRLAQFGNPTGIVDAKVIVTRSDPKSDGSEGDIGVAGTLTFTKMTAAFHRFPYEFTNMTGEISFDDTKVSLVRIDGEAPGGVKVVASGTIAPPTDDAFVEINVDVTNLPIDHRLYHALGHRKRILDEIFNPERYRQLIEKGLVASSEQHQAAKAEIERAEQVGEKDTPRLHALYQVLARPVFDLGGRANVSVKVNRVAGPDSEWTDVENIRLSQAGILPQQFPLPMVARDLVIVKRDAGATVEGGDLRGLNGGTARVTAKVDFDRIDKDDHDFVPDVTISAKSVPIDQLLINALPDTKPKEGDLDLQGMMNALNISGSADVDATVGMTPANEPGFNVKATLRDVRARPLVPHQGQPDDPRLELSAVAGDVSITQDALALDLNMNVGRPTLAGQPPAPTTRAEVRFGLPIQTDSQKPSPVGGLTATATANRFDVSLPVEDLIEIFAPDTAVTLRELRATHKPTGEADLRTTVSQPLNTQTLTTTVMADNPHRFQFDLATGRIELQGHKGGVTITNASNSTSSLTFQNLEGDLRFNNEPAGEFTADGPITFEGKPVGNAPFAASIKGGRFESPLVRALLIEHASKSVSDFVVKASPFGVFDADLRLTPTQAQNPTSPWDMKANLVPHNASFVYEGTVLTFPTIKGGFEVGTNEGQIKNLALTAPDWSATLDGTWLLNEGGGAAIQTTLNLKTNTGLPADLRAILPTDLKDGLSSLSFDVAGPVEVTDNHISLAYDPNGDLTAFKAKGRVALRGTKMDVGVLISRIEGVLEYAVSRPSLDTPTEFQLWGLLDYLSASGVNMTKGRVRVVSGDNGSILIPLFSADCHGGRVAGSATLLPPFRRNDKRRFEVQVQASDVRLASLISDFENETLVGPPPFDATPDNSRGRLDAGLTIGGIIGEPSTRRGRGAITIGGGRIVNMPLLVALIRITNLQFPISERLDYAIADFYLHGTQIVFSEIAVSSQSVDVYGYGTATMPDLNLDLRFKTKSRRRIPVYTAIVENVRNELFIAEVGGTLGQPDIRVRTLPNTARFFGRIFGEEPTTQDRQLEAIEARAKTDPRRNRPMNGQAIQPR